ncbi:DUF3888 domain-containing protein [Terrilactibacillus sp. BCM23-1]|uniref:DUF3888 domain-containing protein n=1 Tax=Terrilactibacillus tamarindi TaxID=2599694 RepID=A0A6N8CLF4_9BACI|nr:DUF3888 domain-containing protein [Terrilactibacillus tamarindi]MTT30739.1 DUF3888 domain-containing protein [Terrilactibacillus tamarindi]
MKKTCLLFFVVLLMFSSNPKAFAKENIPEINANEQSLSQYTTSEKLLIALLEPDIQRIVDEQYGKKMTVSPFKVDFITSMTNGAGKGEQLQSWYQMDVYTFVNEGHKKPTLDRLILKINAPYFGKIKVSGEMRDIKVELVKYSKGIL